jgi:PAS domain S-box-containing protein
MRLTPGGGARAGWTTYAWAAGGVLAAFVLRQSLAATFGPGIPLYGTLYPVVMLATLLGGPLSGLTAAALGAFLSIVWSVPPGDGDASAIGLPARLVGLGLYFAVCAVIAGGAEFHRRTRMRADRLARELVARESREALRDGEARVREDARAALEREKSIFQAVVNGARKTHLVYLDRDFNFVRVNETYATGCGYTPEEMVGRNHFALYPHEENEAIFKRVRDTAVAAEFRDKPFVFPDQPHRGVTYWDWTLLPVQDADGRVEGLVFSLVETTERKRAEVAMIEADRRKSEFLATLSHELRNPLAPIRYALELLAGSAEPQDQARAREVIDRQLRHLVRLVDDLLDVTRIASNKLQLRRQVVRLDGIVQQAVESSAPSFERGRQRFSVVAPPPDVWVDADPDRMVQVLTNLLNNAAKFTQVGGLVRLETCADDLEIRMSVSDTGIGLGASDVSRIFNMFVQVGDADQEGLGIGLALVKGTVELHGGTVMAASDGPGKGSTFTVVLPRAPAPQLRTGTEAPQVPSRRRRVLVVDDNLDAAEMMRCLLELQGHQVAVAHDGPSALVAAASFRPEVGLFDIGLPGLDGYELATRLRENPETAGMFLVAVTGWGHVADRQRSRAHGFDAHLTKPADPDVLLALIAQR